MRAIAREAEEDPELVKSAPHHAVIKGVDEVTAARKPIVKWEGGPLRRASLFYFTGRKKPVLMGNIT